MNSDEYLREFEQLEQRNGWMKEEWSRLRKEREELSKRHAEQKRLLGIHDETEVDKMLAELSKRYAELERLLGIHDETEMNSASKVRRLNPIDGGGKVAASPSPSSVKMGAASRNLLSEEITEEGAASNLLSEEITEEGAALNLLSEEIAEEGAASNLLS